MVTFKRALNTPLFLSELMSRNMINVISHRRNKKCLLAVPVKILIELHFFYCKEEKLRKFHVMSLEVRKTLHSKLSTKSNEHNFW